MTNSTQRAANEIAEAIGRDAVDLSEESRMRASRDNYWLSPILSHTLGDYPPADIVVKPAVIDDVREVMKVAYQYQMPVTPRGRGTGNYGQSIPLKGGIVLDLTRLTRVHSIERGWVAAEAGCSFQQLEESLQPSNQELQLIPSTTNSTLGGFLSGGAGGAGSVEHGSIWNNFVDWLDIVPCTADAEPRRVRGEECSGYLHAYGTTGVLVQARVRLRPRRNWIALYYSFAPDALQEAAAAAKALPSVGCVPRLVSLDLGQLVDKLPRHEYMPESRISLRAMAESSTREMCSDLIGMYGGRFEGVDGGPEALKRLHLLSYNHVTLRLKQQIPDIFHLQLSGDSVITELERVLATAEDGSMHMELQRRGDGFGFGTLLFSRYKDAQSVDETIKAIEALGIDVVNPHSHFVGEGHLPDLAMIMRLRSRDDPFGLLNSGRIPEEGE